MSQLNPKDGEIVAYPGCLSGMQLSSTTDGNKFIFEVVSGEKKRSRKAAVEFLKKEP